MRGGERGGGVRRAGGAAGARARRAVRGALRARAQRAAAHRRRAARTAAPAQVTDYYLHSLGTTTHDLNCTGSKTIFCLNTVTVFIYINTKIFKIKLFLDLLIRVKYYYLTYSISIRVSLGNRDVC